MIPVYVISLARSHDRRSMVAKQMQHLAIDYSFIDAVDGKQIDSQILKQVDFEQAKAFCGHELSLGEVGCAMSHIKVYELMVAQNIKRCVVLEDDIYLHMHFKALVSSAINQTNDDIIFLHHGKAKYWPWMKKLTQGYRLAKYISPSKTSHRGIISTAGYIITLTGAKKLLNVAYPVRMPSDYLTGRLQLNQLSACGIEPCCLDVGLFDSTIDDRNYGHHI